MMDLESWITCPRCNNKPGDFDDPRYGCNRCHGGGPGEYLSLGWKSCRDYLFAGQSQ